jgi:hypothetical protein
MHHRMSAMPTGVIAPGGRPEAAANQIVGSANRTRATRIHDARLGSRESDSGLFSLPRDQLWTGGALSVDGPAVPLRRFRKSHHFVQANLGVA